MQLRESARKGSDNSGCLIRPCFLTRAPYSTAPVAQGTRFFWEYSYQTHSLAGQTSRRIYLVYDCCVCLSRERLQLLVYLQIPPSISPFPISHFQFPVPGFSTTPGLLPPKNHLRILTRTEHARVEEGEGLGTRLIQAAALPAFTLWIRARA